MNLVKNMGHRGTRLEPASTAIAQAARRTTADTSTFDAAIAGLDLWVLHTSAAISLGKRQTAAALRD